MKIEKLTDNKIRVIINTEDLNEIDIDFNLFMNKSTKTQNLFFHVTGMRDMYLSPTAPLPLQPRS